jgi:hypothetical protein
MKDYANDKVFAPIIASSMSPILSSNTQNIATEEMPLSKGMKGKKNGESGGANTEADLNFLGTELANKGGFWV